MSEIKWIKMTTTMFEDEKINFIESLPEADAILIIWIKLLTLAGKSNMNGHIFLTENIPYNDEMLAHKFRRSLNTVRLALQTFQRLGMIELDENSVILISNWEKHQNVEGMEKVREKERLKKRRQRENKRLLQEPIPKMSHDVSRDCPGDIPDLSRPCPDTEVEVEEEIDLEKELYSSTTTSMTDDQEKIDLTKDDKNTRIYDYSIQLLGVHFLDGFDTQCVQRWVEEIPFDTIIEGIDLAFKRYKPSRPGAKIKNIRYCDGAVRDLHYSKQQREQAISESYATPEGGNHHGKHGGDTRKSAEKSTGPSAESRRLEEIARRKGLIRDGEIRNDEYSF